MKNFQKFIILLTCTSLIISITFILQTYAKYATSIDGIASMSIAKWNIIVNNKVIKEDNDLTSVLVPVFEKNSDIADNVIAPTANRLF